MRMKINGTFASCAWPRHAGHDFDPCGPKMASYNELDATVWRVGTSKLLLPQVDRLFRFAPGSARSLRNKSVPLSKSAKNLCRDFMDASHDQLLC
jgi:hypothetical protein